MIKRWRARDQQFSFALRVRCGGERVYVRLGVEADGWNDRAAASELDRISKEIALGIWKRPASKPTHPEIERDPTLHEFASWWLADREAELGQSAYDDYLNLLTNHLLPHFAAHRLTEITYEAIAQYRSEKQAESHRLRTAKAHGVGLHDRDGRLLRPYGPRQINASIALLARILDRAVKSEAYQVSSNPARERDLRVRRQRPTGRRHLEADEVLDVLDAAQELDQPISGRTRERAGQARRLRKERGLPWSDVATALACSVPNAIYLSQLDLDGRGSSRERRTLLAVLALSGLRSGEAASLRWRHVDFTHGRIVVSETKSAAGVREVELSSFLQKELILFQDASTDNAADRLVFPTRAGTARSRQNVNARVVGPAVRLAGARRSARGDAPLPPGVTAHTFRRTFVTMCAQFGRSLAYVQSQVGHTDANTTNRYYLQGSAREADPQIRSLLARLLGGPGTPVAKR